MGREGELVHLGKQMILDLILNAMTAKFISYLITSLWR